MLSGLTSDRALPSLATGATLLLASVFVAVGGSDRTRLGADVLARSRGNNQGSRLFSGSCSANNTNTPCSDPSKGPGATCAACTTTSYPFVFQDGSPGYQTASGPPTAPCGNNVQGACNAAARNCIPVVPQVKLGACANAPNVLVQP